MRLSPLGPELPDDLVQAQERGETLFVCGAGVSRGAGLVLFRELVKGIYAKLGESWEPHPAEREMMQQNVGQYDRVVRALERRLIGQDGRKAQHWREHIRSAVREILTPREDSDLTNHLCLLELSRDSEHRNRLVTTNFDTLFERAWHAAKGVPLPSHACQAMPQPNAAGFSGVLHLHGRLADAKLGIDETDLVLTSAEFGDSYLRNGWASRYLYDLARTHVLVLVGYAADDPPMRYLLEVLEADRERFPDLQRVYAFAEMANGDGELQEALWRAKGVEPILYPVDETGSHDSLYWTIREWSRYAEDPTAWRRERLKALLLPDPASLESAALVEATALLKHGDADRLLGEISPSPAWLPELTRRGVISNEGASGGPWICARLDDPEMVRACASALPSETAWNHIDWMLSNKDKQPPIEYRTAWRWIALARRAQRLSWQAQSLFLPDRAASAEDEFAFRTTVVGLFVPRLQVRRPLRWPFLEEAEDKPITARSLVEADFEAGNALPVEDVLKVLSDEPAKEERLLRSLCRSLEDALDEAQAAGFIDSIDRASHDVPSIADHEQNESRGGFLPLVRLIGKIWERLAIHARYQARPLASGWARSEYRLFQRLYFHALTNPVAFEAAEAMDALMDISDDALWSFELRRETMRLMAERWNEFPVDGRSRLMARIVNGPPRSMFRVEVLENSDEWMAVQDHCVFVRLARISSAGGNMDPQGLEALQAIRGRHPEWTAGIGDRDDFTSWHTSSRGPLGDPSILASTPDTELVPHALQLQRDQPWASPDLWRQFCVADPERALGGLETEAAEGKWDPTAWQEFLWAAAETESPDLQQRVAGLIVLIPDPTLVAILSSAASWLQRCREQLVHSLPGMPSPFFRTWDHLAGLAYSQVSDDRRETQDDDIGNATLSEPGGQLAWTLVDALDASKPASGTGLGGEFEPRFSKAMSALGRPGLLARAYVIRFLPWFFSIAPDWTSAHLLPLLASDDADAGTLWKARLAGSIARDPILFNALKPFLLAQFRNPPVATPAAEGLACAILLPMLWKREEDKGWDIKAQEVRTALEVAPAALRQSAAWLLWRWVEDKDNETEDSASRWSRIFGPFFKDCWPQNAACRDQTTSRHLVHVAVAAGTAFDDAVHTISPVLVPFDMWSVRTIWAHSGFGADLPNRYPCSVVALLNTLIDAEKARPPGDLGEVLATCLSAEPELADNPAYRRLHAISRRQSA